MLLRSSSTPILGSLLSSFSDSPCNNNNNTHHETNTTIKHHHHHHPPSTHPNHKKLSFHQTAGSFNLTTASCNSSPISPSIAEFSEFHRNSHKGFRRAQSEGNLEGLAYASQPSPINNIEEFHDLKPQRKISGRPRCSMLQTIPSFSFYNSRGWCEDEEGESDIEEGEEGEELEENEEILGGNRRDGERIMAMEFGGEIGLDNKEGMVFTEEVRVLDKIWNMGFEGEGGLLSQEMHLARGLGIEGGSGGGGGGGGGGGRSGEFNPVGSGGDGGDNQSVEEHYKRMVEENPGNSLFLRNYAQFLYQSKQDLQGAEEYFSRAILIDPKDGEILSQYAKLVWELHHEQDRALSYFERAVQASPEDSHVHAAYASFLWEADNDECNEPRDHDAVPQCFHQGAIPSAV